jgi:three-Cys-motif partner protein
LITKEPGFSDTTRTKLEHFQAILNVHLALTRAVLAKNRYYRRTYHYIDATAGPGWYPEEQCNGSPLVFLELVKYHALPYQADFIEINPTTFDFLQQHAGSYPNVRLRRGDFSEVILNVIKDQRKMQLGLLYVDHNGIGGNDLSVFTLLRYAARMRPRMDVLLHIPVAALKRNYYNHGQLLSDCMDRVKKEHWLIREPIGGWQWTFLQGSNTDLFKDYKRIGFYRLASPQGQEIYDRLNTIQTRKESKSDQLALPQLC